MVIFIRRLFWVFVAFVLIAFSISNRDVIFLQIPFTEMTVPMGLYFVFFMGLFVGIVLAGTALSWTRLKGFVARRQAEREATHLRARVQTQEEEETAATAAEKYQMVSDASKE